MSKKGRNRFSRSTGSRRYKRMFVLSTEGTNTEPQYFRMLNSDSTVVHHVKILKNKGSDPKTVLREMERYLVQYKLEKEDEAWVVVDKDSWTDDQLSLLLHFEEGNGISNSRECSQRLSRYIPGNDKNLNPEIFRDQIENAVQRAERKDHPPCSDWPKNTGTTVYRLVKRILSGEEVK